METIPKTMADSLAYFADFSAKLTAAPARYGLDADAAESLAAFVTTAQSAMSARTAIEGQKEASVEALTTAMETLTASVRTLSNIARFTPDVTDEALAELGLRRRLPPSPIAAPADPPVLAIQGLSPGIVRLSVRQMDVNAPRGRPEDAAGAEIVLVNGTGQPVENEAETGIRFFRTRSVCNVPTTVLPVARIRVYARWLTARGLHSPYSAAISFNPQT